MLSLRAFRRSAALATTALALGPSASAADTPHVEVPQRMRLATALERGISVRLDLDEPGRVVLSARIGDRRFGRYRRELRAGRTTMRVWVRRTDLGRGRGAVRTHLRLSMWCGGKRTDTTRRVVLERGADDSDGARSG